MPDKPEARIIAQHKPDGSCEISVYEPHSGRHHRTGWHVDLARDVPAKIRQLKEGLERAGNFVTVKEM